MKSKSLKNDTTLDSPKVRENRGIFGKLRRPKISIIVPVVNDGRYLNRCLDSILTSDFAEYDVFVAMGATFDNTRDIAKEYAGKYARIHVIKAESQMAAITRSVTLSMGKYIMFISPYDQITSDTLSKYYEAAMKNGANIVFSKVLCRQDNGDDFYEEFAFSGGAYDSEDYLTYLTKEQRIDKNRYSKMYLKTLVKSCLDGYKYADSSFLPLVFSYAGSFAYLNEVLYIRDESAHRKAIKDKEDWMLLVDSIESKSEEILFFCEQGRPAEFVPLAKYAYMQIDKYAEECKDQSAFVSCVNKLKAISEKDRLDRYEEALRIARNKQRFIRVIIAILIASRLITRLYGYYAQIVGGF